jgi:hypothetical protein
MFLIYIREERIEHGIEGYHPGDAPVLIDHDGDLESVGLKIPEHLVRPLFHGDKKRLFDQALPPEMCLSPRYRGQQVF